jgi:hypothetical protein
LAADLSEKIKSGVLGERFTVRDVYMKGWAGLDTPDAVQLAVGVLSDGGWVRRIEVPPGPRGGRRSEHYVVNPGVRRG